MTTTSATALVDAADAARDRHDWPAAVRAYAAALAVNGDRADLWVQYGHALKESGDLGGALRAYQAALERAPDVADTHLQLGHALKMSGRRDAAAAAYARAAVLDPAHPDPVKELRDLVRHGLVLDPEIVGAVRARTSQTHRRNTDAETLTGHLEAALKRLGAGLKAVRALATGAGRRRSARPALIFDTSDLIAYFRDARLPTGIQRVQIEVITALLRDPPADAHISVCAFIEDRDDWVEIPANLFLGLTTQALAGGALNEAAWLTVRYDLDLETGLAPALAFPEGAWLINLGTSWWLQNYFLKLRNIRRLRGVRYIPFVHDMIPVMAPEHCTPALTRDFISWAVGIVGHAGHFLTNSEASRRDLIAVASRLGQAIDADDVHVIRLDADFRKPGPGTTDDGILPRLGLCPDRFVLFVSTVESRKNHIAAFQAWRVLIDRHGAGTIPTLVCVGARGWLNDAVFALLDSDPVLRSRVIMVSGVSDADLADLYRTCAFTLYPSLYEGWGLPVTEALCHGKAVLASDASSLPEAGGEFATYFRSGDPVDLLAQLERMLFEPDFRQDLEEQIARTFRPRSWRDLGQEIVDCVVHWNEQSGPGETAAAIPVPPVEPGRAYSLGRLTATRLKTGLMSAEIFRTGEGWAAPDTWGCWTTGDGAELVFRMPQSEPVRDLRLVMGLRGPSRHRVDYTIMVGMAAVARGRLTSGEVSWLDARIPAGAIVDGAVHLRISEPDTTETPTGSISRHRQSIGVIGFMLDTIDSDRTATKIIAEIETAVRAPTTKS
ncbi:glycosyltransferase [uncultured Brevundimonas sp.]|uniref:glycosyltransferase n=1 Tax=uncultured Brevundimonas sp. TaxID=213418 RepID=UPI0030EB2919|tara:strand:- start:5855 stop:8194 length:2340 start_codon:yes stop_codon:yes gene_type:complete